MRLCCAVRDLILGSLIPNWLLTPTGLQQLNYQRNWSKQSCKSVNVCACVSPLQASFSMNTNMCLSVTFATAMLIDVRRTTKGCSGLFQYDLSLSVLASGIVDTFPDSESSRYLWATSQFVEARHCFVLGR